MPLISGIAVYIPPDNETEEEFAYIDTNSSSRLALWSPGADGLCEGASRGELEFGMNAHTSCMLRLSLDDLMDCDELR